MFLFEKKNNDQNKVKMEDGKMLDFTKLFEEAKREKRNWVVDYELCELFAKKTNKNERSAMVVAGVLKKLVHWVRDNDIKAPQKEDVKKYVDFLLDGKGIKKTTVQGYLSVIRRFFRWLDMANIYPDVAKDIHISVRGTKPKRARCESKVKNGTEDSRFFTPENEEFIKFISKIKNISTRGVVNEIIAKEREKKKEAILIMEYLCHPCKR